ncbi:hypothetical protein [Chryseobacterium sp. CFS15]|uniref:hypothetical protein n=1 Tax=Chryseobacterium sp. CFS15 TaxID=2986946 RepID=UPI0028071F8F|nr:hypothetical protein [Chryseobacterium sp. CFS15]MDQ8141133.1 hypothetical protein [Chryseobacterium sp. CFS15]
MEINNKIYFIGIFLSLFSCSKRDENVIFVQENSKNHSKYNFIINNNLNFPIKKDSTNHILKKDTLYLKYENELVKYHKLDLGDISAINYDTIYISFKNIIDSPFNFNYDMNISSNGQVSVKVYGYEGNQEMSLIMTKPFEDWVYYTLKDFNKWDEFYGTKSADDKSEMIIILKNKNKSKLVYGDLNALPSRIQLLSFVLEVYLKQSFTSKNFTKVTNDFPSEDSLKFYSQKTGIGKGRIPPPPTKK